jgi:hypothetical protein
VSGHVAAGRRAILAAALLLLAACGGMKDIMPDTELNSFLSKTTDVEFGMTKQLVQYYMGAPRSRLYEGNQEAWQWCQTSNNPQRADAFLVVYFYGARVAGIHSYGNRAEGICENFFRPIQWLADPEKEMAQKQRRRE